MNSLLDALRAPLQEVFDVAGERLLRQGARSCDEYGTCVYDDGNGRHCAVGLLMSKEELDKAKKLYLNGNSVGSLVGFCSNPVAPSRSALGHLGYFDGSVALEEGVQSINVTLLTRLQTVHDRNIMTTEFWRAKALEGLADVASHYGLNTTKINEVYDELSA